MSSLAAPHVIAPNDVEPAGLRFYEALNHVLQGQVFRNPVLPGFILLLLLTWFAGMLLAVFAGIALALCLLAIVYMSWYELFLFTLNRRGVLCPSCTSRMWQFCCGRCGECVPALAFMWRGAFLASCPHCRLRISSRRGTLKAWCSTCGGAADVAAHVFYRQFNTAVLRIVPALPAVSGNLGEWRLVANPSPTRLVLYHPGNLQSASFLIMIASADSGLIEPHLAAKILLLQVAKSIPKDEYERHQARFPKTSLEFV